MAVATAKIRSFKDLQTWQAAYDLSIAIYKLTDKFPETEKFGLTNQLRRAAVSIASNIAEGFSRQGAREKVQLYHMARGSLSEVECQLLIAHGVGYIANEQLESVQEKTLAANRLLTALLKSVRSK